MVVDCPENAGNIRTEAALIEAKILFARQHGVFDKHSRTETDRWKDQQNTNLRVPGIPLSAAFRSSLSGRVPASQTIDRRTVVSGLPSQYGHILEACLYRDVFVL